MADHNTDHPSDNRPTRLSGIFKIIIVISCIILVSIIANLMKIHTIRTNWVETRGEVIQKSSKGWWSEEAQKRYYLKYRYEAKGQYFENSRFHIKEDSLKRYKHLIAHLHQGESVGIWYNPDNPGESVINTDYLSNGFVILIVMVGFLVLSWNSELVITPTYYYQ